MAADAINNRLRNCLSGDAPAVQRWLMGKYGRSGAPM